ncbi:MAG: LysR family transcriptional regulator [Anaerolineae bacterium]|nr:LysR family transcriptional regulator [Gloeobacterales cyanobacterium ES-bin-313]
MINNQVDLNLLTILLVLLRERSVTRTARLLGVSQPTVSRALAALREQLGDELLIRTRKGMEPTAIPRRLIEPSFNGVREVLSTSTLISLTMPPNRQISCKRL